MDRDPAGSRLSLRVAGGRTVSLRATLLLALTYVVLLALIALGVPLAVSLRDRVDSEVRAQARSQADVVAVTAEEALDQHERAGLRGLVDASGASVRGRVIVVDARGRVLADSAEPAQRGADYSSRPEIASALRGSAEQITRASSTLGGEILATAVPVAHDGRTVGAVRITQSIDAVNRAIRTATLEVALLTGVVLLLSVGVAALIAQRLARPIRRLDHAARQVAEGDLDTTVEVEGSAEQRSLARAFNQMTQRIRRLVRAHQDFVADASHQLRTPLTGLRLRLENMSDRLDRTDPVAGEADAALREVDRLAQIVDELLILSRAGEHEAPGATVELADVATRAARRWREPAADRGIELDVDLDDGGTAWCSPADLDRAIDSLVENATRYAPPDSKISIVAEPGAINVLDDGPGLEAGEEDSVFERFNRGSAGRAGPGGTGLGLAIARELVRSWGGRVTLANRSGGGARARIEMPPDGGFTEALPGAAYRRPNDDRTEEV